jgi:hypothetical protein
MHGLHELKRKIIEELEEYGMRNEVKASELPTIDTLAHTAKNLCKIIAMCEEETGYSYGDRYYGRTSRGMSYPRGRRMYDDMGGYSGGGEWVIEMLEDLKEKAPNENMRHEFDEFIRRMKK